MKTVSVKDTKTQALPAKKALVFCKALDYRRAVTQRAEMRSILARATIQPKLRVGPADDAYEREADSVADRVMRMPEPGLQRKPT